MEEHEYMIVEEAAAYLQVAKTTIYRLAQKGVIPGVKLGRLWRFKRSELDRWLAQQSLQNLSSSDNDKTSLG